MSYLPDIGHNSFQLQSVYTDIHQWIDYTLGFHKFPVYYKYILQV